MAHCHNQNHHSTTSNCCCHQSPPPCHHPSPPPSPHPTTDAFQIASIVAHLLQTQFQTQIQPHITPSPPTSLSSLLQRIDSLESSLHRHHLSPSSSSSSQYLRNAAARVIQTYFRRFLVRRSRTLSHLQQLSVIKSELVCLKSSFSDHNLVGFVDFDSISHRAMNLLLQLDSILGEDQMIRDSKKSITREIVQFLELVDGVCVKRHQVLTRKMRNMRLVRNDYASARRDTHDGGRQFAERGGVSKSRNVDSNDKKLIKSLRERVEKIGRMSRALEEDVGEDEVEGFERFDVKGHIVDQTAGSYRLNNGVDSNALRFNGKTRVCFVEDGNMIRVYNTDGDKRSVLREVEEIDDAAKDGLEEEEEAISDAEKSSQSSEDTKNHRDDQVDGNHKHEEFAFSAPGPSKMERADVSKRKPGLKIVG